MTSTRYEQPELPLGDASLADHKDKTGHDPVITREGWICTERTGDKRCMASWPPAGTFEVKFEGAILDVLATGRADIPLLKDYTLEIDFGQQSFPVLPDAKKLITDHLT